MNTKTISGYIVLNCNYHREGKQWVGVCEELGISSFGSTIEEAKESLEELIGLHLDTLEDLGERDRVFRENKIKIRTVRPKSLDVTVPVNGNHYTAPCVFPLRDMALA